jgi:hypothetical protein
MSEEQRTKDRVRSKAAYAKKRGRIKPEPCQCGAPGEEMHHPDYAKPLEVVWMCRPCHVHLHLSNPPESKAEAA